jgi:hypothetical protein
MFGFPLRLFKAKGGPALPPNEKDTPPIVPSRCFRRVRRPVRVR